MKDVTFFKIPETLSAAFMVLSGEYGINEERVNKLKKDGYDPVKVQKCVNDLITIIYKYSDDG